MILPNPVTIKIPDITMPDGNIKKFSPITIRELDITIIDNLRTKTVKVNAKPLPKQLVLWENEAYDNIGDYTQAQVDARVLEILGNDPKSFIESLFSSVVKK